jgi:hypothetical protein
MKIGLSLKIDVTKLDKSRFFKGDKGTYVDLTTFIDLDELDQYGNNGFITQSTSKEERQNGVKLPILGNSKVFFKEGQQQQAAQGNYQAQQALDHAGQKQDNFSDDIPF